MRINNVRIRCSEVENSALSAQEYPSESLELTDAELAGVTGGANVAPYMPSATEVMGMLNAALHSVPLLNL